MKSYKVFEIIADGFGFPEDVNFYDAMGYLKFNEPEIYGLMVQAMTQDVIANIKGKV